MRQLEHLDSKNLHGLETSLDGLVLVLYLMERQKQAFVCLVIMKYHESPWKKEVKRFFLFDLILYVPSKIFQLNETRSSWVEPVLSLDKRVMLNDHNAVMPVRLKPVTPRFRVKHSTYEPLPSLRDVVTQKAYKSQPLLAC